MKSRLLQTASTSGLTLAAFLGLVAPAEAVIPGENGRIVLISGRTAGDATAEPFLLPVPSSAGGGTLSPPIVTGGGQHRHPTWSPDRTKIAYARGTAGNFDIFVLDLTTPGATPVRTSRTRTTSPTTGRRGRRTAREHRLRERGRRRQQPDRRADPRAAGGGAATNLTNTAAPTFEGKPVWSPDLGRRSTTTKRRPEPMVAANSSIVKRPAGGGTETLAIADSGPISEFQPSISPDGERMCFTLSVGGFNGSANVHVALLTDPPSTGVDISDDIVAGDYNCTWSPDGRFVAYVNGIFGTGRLVMTRSERLGSLPDRARSGPRRQRLRRQPGVGARRTAAVRRPDGRDAPRTPRSRSRSSASTRDPSTSAATCASSRRPSRPSEPWSRSWPAIRSRTRHPPASPGPRSSR